MRDFWGFWRPWWGLGLGLGLGQGQRLGLGLVLLLATAGVRPVVGQEFTGLVEQIEALAADESLDAERREKALAVLQEAQMSQAAANLARVRAVELRGVVEQGLERVAKVREELAALVGEPAAEDGPVAGADMTTPQLEQRLAEHRAAAAALRSEVVDLDAAAVALAERPMAARLALAELQRQLESLRDPATSPVVDEAAAVTRARAALAQARQAELNAKAEALEQELLSLPSQRELVAARRELVETRRAREEARARVLEAQVDARNRADALQKQAAAEASRSALTGRHPALVRYADETAALSARLTELALERATLESRYAAARGRLSRLERNARSADQVLNLGAVSEEFGELVRELRRKLPDTSQLNLEVALREKQIVGVRLMELRLAGQLRAMDVDDADVVGLGGVPLRPGDPALAGDDHATFKRLRSERQEVLGALVAAQSQQVGRLAELNAAEQHLVTESNQLARRLDERLLWLPSAGPAGRGWPAEVAVGFRWVATPQHWLEAGRTVLNRIGQQPLLTFLVALAAGGLLWRRRLLLARRAALSVAARGVSTDRFSLTPRTFLLTLLLAAPTPLVLGHVGWLMSSDASQPTFAQAVGGGLLAAALVLMILLTFRRMTDADGVFGAHFGWSEPARKVLGRNLGWLALTEAAAVWVVVVGERGGGPEGVYHDGMGRLAFMFGAVALAVFMFRVMHPTRGAVRALVTDNGWADRLKVVWFPAVVLVPVLLALLAARGYFETAAQIQSRLFTTAWVVLLAVTVQGMGVRWVQVAHRKLAVQRTQEARAAALKKRARLVAEKGAGDAVPELQEVLEIDPESVSQQTRRVLRVAVGAALVGVLWFVWAQLVPALGVLDDITLWTAAGAVDVDTGQAGEVPVTLFGVVVALFVVGMTWVAGSNLPGLLEITVLQRLSIDAGTRYAITTVCRYVITAVGLLLAFNQLGVPWNKFHWIVAALGVGLGFGLQEIVANFVSGLIILVERPVRVGDTVTVNGLSGTVSRIEIRATTIVDWDNREILVPNKSFITDQVVNWTLSNPVTRVVIKVGVGYDADAETAHRVIMSTVGANPLVLKNPAPTAFFLGFGESSLDFEVRVFVSELSKRLVVTHELHGAIHRALEAAGIEIPFPQRGVHVRSGAIGSTPEPA